jgi:hypothetical protein
MWYCKLLQWISVPKFFSVLGRIEYFQLVDYQLSYFRLCQLALEPTFVNGKKVKKLLSKSQQNQEHYFNKRSGKPLKELKNNETVMNPYYFANFANSPLANCGLFSVINLSIYPNLEICFFLFQWALEHKVTVRFEYPNKALLDYRNTPLVGIELSPAQLQIGRRLKSSLPTSSALLEPPFVNGKKVKKNC